MIVPLNTALLAAILMALVIFATRAFPFVLFSRRKPPKLLIFIEKYIPPMIMAVLVVYCFKSVSFTVAPFGIPELGSLLFVVLVHLWQKNAMLSIFGGTILYMVLIGVL
ncbi:MAG: AzlD domain-containing protein [Spirochaetaceae bacterium]|jgi:branched-subunit amino acid transport protein AzlD|nr:AzlD domain-containing protein [Spirochaetaceae bacterium]